MREPLFHNHMVESESVWSSNLHPSGTKGNRKFIARDVAKASLWVEWRCFSFLVHINPADFNFFKFQPGSNTYRFTPYLTFGVGAFSFDPYAYLPGDDEPYDLNSRMTEGQSRPYEQNAFVFPLGMGLKYNLYRNFNVGFEIVYRFTTTDYLDDVSTTYAGANMYTPGTPSYILQDRSLNLPMLGIAGKQRGFSQQKDQYVFAQITLSMSFNSYKCVDIR